MTSRERILATIEHREPDTVPVDLGSTPRSGISAIAYNTLKTFLQMDSGPTRVYDVVQQLAQPDMALLDRFGIDVPDIGRTFNTADRDWRDTTLTDGSSALYPRWFEPEPKAGGGWIARSADGTPIAEMPQTGTFFDQTYFPYVDGYPASYANLDEAMGKVL
jgi:uroporphyrinogen decarboxylase